MPRGAKGPQIEQTYLRASRDGRVGRGARVLEFSSFRGSGIWKCGGGEVEYKAVLRVRVEINKINDVTVEQPPAKTGAWS
jgi:hypothetical protein